jgi:hypothetical protein
VTSLQAADNAKVMGELQFRHVRAVIGLAGNFLKERRALKSKRSQPSAAPKGA